MTDICQCFEYLQARSTHTSIGPGQRPTAWVSSRATQPSENIVENMTHPEIQGRPSDVPDRLPFTDSSSRTSRLLRGVLYQAR